MSSCNRSTPGVCAWTLLAVDLTLGRMGDLIENSATPSPSLACGAVATAMADRLTDGELNSVFLAQAETPSPVVA